MLYMIPVFAAKKGLPVRGSPLSHLSAAGGSGLAGAAEHGLVLVLEQGHQLLACGTEILARIESYNFV